GQRGGPHGAHARRGLHPRAARGHAARGRPGPGRGPAGDAPDRLRLDPGRGPVPAAAHRAGRPRMTVRIRAFLCVLLIACAGRFAGAQDASWKLEKEFWYVMEIGGAPAGWTWIRQETDGERYRTSTETKLSLG